MLILQISIKKIVLAEYEKTFKITPEGKAIRLDVYVNDEAGSVYDIEMQTTGQKALAKRTRYYQAMLDISMIDQGAAYNDLKKCFIIFICLEDPFLLGRHVYKFTNIAIKEERKEWRQGLLNLYMGLKSGCLPQIIY